MLSWPPSRAVVERRIALAQRKHVCAAISQELDHFGVPLHARCVQGRVTKVASFVDVDEGVSHLLLVHDEFDRRGFGYPSGSRSYGNCIRPRLGPCAPPDLPRMVKILERLEMAWLRIYPKLLFEWTSPIQKQHPTQSYNLTFTKFEIMGESETLWARLLAYVIDI